MASESEPCSLPTSDFIQNEENVDIYSKLKSPNMKTVPQLVQGMYPVLKDSKGKDSNSTGRPKSLSTRSPIRPNTKRKGLATLQPSAAGKGSVVGALRSDNVFSNFQKSKKESNALNSPVWSVSKQQSSTPSSTLSSSCVTTTCTSTQTDVDEWLSLNEISKKDDLAEEALELLRSDPSEEKFYKEIAEERRVALQETLKENEELYDEIDLLKAKCEKLEKELNEAENYKLLYISMCENADQCECGKELQKE